MYALVFQIPVEKVFGTPNTSSGSAFRGSKHRSSQGIWIILED